MPPKLSMKVKSTSTSRTLTLTSGRDEVFYTIWRKYRDLDFSFLRKGMLRVIEGFKAKLAKDATPLTLVLNDEVFYSGKVVEEMMDEDEGRQ